MRIYIYVLYIYIYIYIYIRIYIYIYICMDGWMSSLLLMYVCIHIGFVTQGSGLPSLPVREWSDNVFLLLPGLGPEFGL